MHFYSLDHEASFEDLKKFNYPNQKIGVIAHIENKDGEILLQQRGVKSRDENGLYEDIGGKVESGDVNFLSAIESEIKEETGDEINWIFVIYFVKYIDGNFKIMEKDKCTDYHFFKYDEAINSELVTESCKYLIKSIKNSRR